MTRSLSLEEHERLQRYLRQHGRSCMAYSTLQPGLDYFVHERLGYLAYLSFRHWLFAPRGLRVVLGDPVAAVDDYAALLDSYLLAGGAAATVFVEIGDEFACLLNSRGFAVNELGLEWDIDLAGFDLALPGQPFSHLRRWRNKARNEMVEVVEGQICALDHNELHTLNTQWLKKKGGQEFIGLTRPFTPQTEPDVRYFWATQRGRLLSLAVFDPIYRNGHVIGYLHNHSRTISDAPHGTTDLIVLHALAVFRREGRERLSLGLSPFALLHDGRFCGSKTLLKLFRFMFRHCSFIYPFKGNLFHKEKYRGQPVKVYLSSIPALNIYRVLGVFKALRLF